MREKAFLIWNIHTLILLLKRISISIFFYISKFEINLKTSKNYDFCKNRSRIGLVHILNQILNI